LLNNSWQRLLEIQRVQMDILEDIARKAGNKEEEA
jgi:hypothetical protein